MSEIKLKKYSLHYLDWTDKEKVIFLNGGNMENIKELIKEEWVRLRVELMWEIGKPLPLPTCNWSGPW